MHTPPSHPSPSNVNPWTLAKVKCFSSEMRSGVCRLKTDKGFSFAVRDFGGPAKAPVLLFLPANGFHGACYEPMVCSTHTQATVRNAVRPC